MCKHVWKQLIQFRFIWVVFPCEDSQAKIYYLKQFVRKLLLHLTGHLFDKAEEVSMQFHLSNHFLYFWIWSLEFVIGRKKVLGTACVFINVVDVAKLITAVFHVFGDGQNKFNNRVSIFVPDWYIELVLIFERYSLQILNFTYFKAVSGIPNSVNLLLLLFLWTIYYQSLFNSDSVYPVHLYKFGECIKRQYEICFILYDIALDWTEHDYNEYFDLFR